MSEETVRGGGASRTGVEDVHVLCVGRDAERVAEGLRSVDGQLVVSTAATAAAAREQLVAAHVDCLVSEYDLPEGDGVALLEEASERQGSLATVLYTDAGSEAVACEASVAGVDRYRPKGDIEESVAALASDVVDAVETRRRDTETLDRMTDAFVALDDQWRFTYLNERAGEVVRAAAATERAVDEYEGRDFWAEIPDVVGTPFEERYREAMTDQHPVTFEEFYEPLGEWFEVRAYPSPSGLSIFFREVTERKEYESQLERREEVLQQLYRVTADKTLEFGEKVRKLLDIGRGELGTEYGSLSRIEGEEYVFEYVRSSTDNDSLSEGDVVPLAWTSCERAVTTKETLVVSEIADEPDLDGLDGNLELGLKCYLGTPVIVDDEVTGTFCFYDTEPRAKFSQWEVTLVDLMGNWVSYERERLRQEAELERERNRLEEFASVVSHDLRNPLNIATSNLELAREDHDSEHIDDAAAALERMADLIDDVLSLARLGQQVVETEPVALQRVAEQAWATATVEGTLVVDPATVVGDERRLQRLCENLFRNAGEHGGPGVTVHVGPLESGDGFYVADDGPGIPPEKREQVLESGYSTRTDGTGYGLTIVTEIAEAHGGSVAVTESESGGARFEIRGLEMA